MISEPSAPQPAPEDEVRAAAAMLELLSAEQDRLSRRMAAGLPAILSAWGVAWLVGFGMLWLIDGAKPAFSIPLPVAATSFIALMVAAIVVSAVVGARMGRGIRQTGSAAWIGIVYGLAWPVSYLGLFALGGALRRAGMPQEAANIYYSTVAVLIVGIMYFLAGGIWRSWQALAMGAWIVLIAVVAPFLGYPTHYLVFALAGGGVFVVAAAMAWIWTRGAAQRTPDEDGAGR